MSARYQDVDIYYWVVMTIKVAGQHTERGFPDYYYRHEIAEPKHRNALWNPEYLEIYCGTKEQITVLSGIRDYYQEDGEIMKEIILSRMVRIK